MLELTSLEMPVTNETHSSLPNKLLFHEDTRMLCYTNRKVWLMNLTVTINTIQCHSMGFVSFLFFLYVLHFRHRRSFLNDRTEDESEVIYNPEHRSLFYATYCILDKEIRLVTVYVLSAVIYKWLVWMDENNTITSLNISQWLIEATWAPFVITLTLIEIPEINEENMEDRYAGCYRMAIAIKIPTFIVIRYAETYPASGVNDTIASLFRITCR